MTLEKHYIIHIYQILKKKVKVMESFSAESCWSDIAYFIIPVIKSK